MFMRYKTEMSNIFAFPGGAEGKGKIYKINKLKVYLV